MMTHMMRVHKEGMKVECPKCKKKFDGQNLLMKHLNQVDCTTPKNFQCDDCRCWYKTRGALSNHEQVHYNLEEAVKKKKEKRARKLDTDEEEEDEGDTDDGCDTDEDEEAIQIDTDDEEPTPPPKKKPVKPATPPPSSPARPAKQKKSAQQVAPDSPARGTRSQIKIGSAPAPAPAKSKVPLMTVKPRSFYRCTDCKKAVFQTAGELRYHYPSCKAEQSIRRPSQ